MSTQEQENGFYAPPQDLKPRKGSFVFPRIVMACILSGLLGVVTTGVLVMVEKSPWLGLAAFAAGCLIGVLASLAAYRKERYQIHDSRVVCHRGGLASDQTTEFEIRNITHVRLKLPWLRFKFFGVGDVIVETAGNAKPVVMRVIREPEAVYNGLRERMKRNGYDLTQRQLLHQEQPAIIGILGECFGLLGGAFTVGLFVVSMIAAERKNAASPALEFALYGALGLAVLGIFAFIIVRYLDFRRRTYRVYNDVVVYEEGFLTCHNAFIPYENIADANTKRSFFDQILGLYDVQVSCQGSNAEIKFRRLKNGVALSAAIDQLVVLAHHKIKPAARSAAGAPAVASQSLPRRAEPETIPIGETLVGEFKMDAARTLIPLLLLLPLFPLWIAAMIQSGIRLACTTYFVRPGSLRHSYQFLTVDDREFAYDKITGLAIKQNLFDHMFGTMTLRFWSIGSGKPLEFTHVRASQINLPALMRQAGIPDASPEPYEVRASFGVLTWLRARLKFLPFWLLIVAGIVIAALMEDPAIYYLLAVPFLIALIHCLHNKLYYSRQRLHFHDHHIEAEQGILVKRRYYARYSNVKRTMVTRYPGGSDGSLEIFVAGEEESLQTGQQQKGQQRALKPCSFITGFLPGVRDQGLLLDDILCGRVVPAPQAVAAAPLDLLLEGRRSLGNALVKLIFVSILIFPLIVLLPLTLPLTVIAVKRWRYRIEGARIVLLSGVFYHREMSILLDRVDSIQQSQGPLNKIFRNGKVSIMTAGSSKPDLNLIDSPEYFRMYEIIRELSQ